MQISRNIVNGPKSNTVIMFWWVVRFGGNFRYRLRLRPETISPLSADLSSATHV